MSSEENEHKKLTKTIKEGEIKIQERLNKLKPFKNSSTGHDLNKKNMKKLSTFPSTPHSDNKVYSCCFGGFYYENILATVGGDGNINVHDVINNRLLVTQNIPDLYILMCVEIDQFNHKFIACGGVDRRVYLYSLDIENFKENETSKITKQQQDCLGHDGQISSIKFLDYRQFISASGDATICQWDSENPSCYLKKLEFHVADVTCLETFKRNNKTFLSGSSDTTIKCFDLRTPEMLVNTFKGSGGSMQDGGHSSDVNSIKLLNANDNFFLSSSEDSKVLLWDMRINRRYLDCYSNDGWAKTGVCDSKSSALFYVGSENGFIQEWDLKNTHNPINEYKAHDKRVSSLCVSPDGWLLASTGLDNKSFLWVGGD